jgi:hypothetical protein
MEKVWGYLGRWQRDYLDVHISVKRPGDHVDELDYTLFVMEHVLRDQVGGQGDYEDVHNYTLLIIEHVWGIS